MITKKILYGSIWPENHVYADLEQQLADALALKINLPAQICRYTDEGLMMQHLKDGTLQFGSTSEIQSSIPQAALMYLPFLYRDIDHFKSIWKFENNAIVRKIEGLIRTNARLEPLGYAIVGARDCILKGKAILKHSDFSGLVMRVDEAEISRKIFEALGARPVTVSFYNVADALENDCVHAAENAPFNMIALGWHTKCKYVSRTGHRFLLNFELASQAFWEELDDDTKASVVSLK